jgi:hypothetical protein
MRGGLIITAAAPRSFAARIFDASTETVGSGAGDHSYPPCCLIDHDLKNGPAPGVAQPRHLAGDAQRRESVHSSSGEQIHHAAQAREVERAIVQERGW